MIKNKKILALFSCIIFGFLFKLLFFHVAEMNGGRYGDSYIYTDYYVERNILETDNINYDIGFDGVYGGMIRVHSNYVAMELVISLLKIVTNKELDIILIFISTTIYLTFGYYALQKITKSDDISLIGTIIMSTAPFDIAFSTMTLSSSVISYLSIFTLYIFLMKLKKEYVPILILFVVTTMLSYYTGIVVFLITVAGLIPYIIYFSNSKLTKYLFSGIYVFVLIYFFLFTSFGTYIANIVTNIISGDTPSNIVTRTDHALSNSLTSTPYSLAFLSEILFLIALIIPNLIQNNKQLVDLLKLKINKNSEFIKYIFVSIPIFISIIAFTTISMLGRVFTYYLFLFILFIYIPKKHKTTYIMMIFIIFASLSFYGNYKEQYKLYTPQEMISANWFQSNHNDSNIFSDQHYASALIMNNMPRVIGISDIDRRNDMLYYTEDKSNITSSINTLKTDYFAITNKMRTQYILSVDFPQTPMTNYNLYEETYDKVYANNDVTIFYVGD